MPRRAKSETAPAAWPRRTNTELGDALGVHRNTITALVREGCPRQADGSFCELQVRVWMAASGRKVKREPEDGLRELLERAGVAGYAVAPAATESDEPKQLTMDEIKRRRAELDLQELEDEQALRRRDLVRMSDVRRLAEAWGRVTGALLDAVPREASASTADGQVALRIEQRVAEHVRHWREQLAEQLADELKRWMEQA